MKDLITEARELCTLRKKQKHIPMSMLDKMLELCDALEKAQEQNKQLMHELCKLACESVEREKVLARLEAEVEAVTEPKRGEWVEAKSGVMSVYPPGQVMCSVCKQRMPSQWKKMPPYCYGCGAKMEDKP